MGGRCRSAAGRAPPFRCTGWGSTGSTSTRRRRSYDHVLCTFTLCTIPDPALAVSEVRRVLRPGGTFAFLEHGLAPTRRMARAQRVLEPLERRVAGGCHLTRDVPALLRAGGLRVTEVRAEYLPGPHSPLTYGYRGSAVAS